ncbi:hypothetical protein FRB98_006417 [Tulasnella sp. 332]|nr:hypothetical protein FRB98_006417 [Tulasnella sp. 332]
MLSQRWSTPLRSITTTTSIHQSTPSTVGSAAKSSFTDFFQQPSSSTLTTSKPSEESEEAHHSTKNLEKEYARISQLRNLKTFHAPLTPPPIQPDLPRPALRTLFALHHAAENFVTHENLDMVIDGAFARSNQLTTMMYKHRSEWKLSELEEEVDKIRTSDSVTDDMRHLRDLKDREEMRQIDFTTQRTNLYLAPTLGQEGRDQVSSWSHTKAESRELAVRAALYGVEPAGKRTRPGLEAVEEHLAVTKAKKKALGKADKELSSWRSTVSKELSGKQGVIWGRRGKPRRLVETAM